MIKSNEAPVSDIKYQNVHIYVFLDDLKVIEK